LMNGRLVLVQDGDNGLVVNVQRDSFYFNYP